MVRCSVGLLLSGSLVVVVLAYVILSWRYPFRRWRQGSSVLSPDLELPPARSERPRCTSLWRVHMPLLVPTLGAAALLVFVDAMKELPATILLSPLTSRH